MQFYVVIRRNINMNDSILEYIMDLIERARNIMTYDVNKSRTLLNKAYSLCESNDFLMGKAYFYHTMALTYRLSSDIIQWLNYSYKSLDLFINLKDNQGIAKCLNSIGSGYFHYGQYENALLCFMQSMEICEKMNSQDSFLISLTLNNMGEVYRATLQFNEAYKYYNMALQKSNDNKYDTISANILLNIGQTLISESNYKESLNTLLESYAISKKCTDLILIGEVLTNLGYNYFLLKDYSKAMEYYDKAFVIFSKTNQKYYTVDLLINIGLLKFELRNTDSLIYFNKAIKYSEFLNLNDRLMKIYDILYKHYEEEMDFKTALMYHKKYHILSESMAMASISARFELLKVKHRHSVKIKELEELNIINEKLKAEITIKDSALKYMRKENNDLKAKALKDALTNLPNRYSLDSKLENLFKNPSNKNKKLVFLILDIDNFKLYNDYWGHPQGDRCLYSIGKCIHEFMDNNSFCARYGGEEFVYMVEDIDFNTANSIGKNLRKKIKQLNLRYYSENTSPIVTVSIGGVYGKLSDFATKETMINVADKELYTSKNSGRDTVSLIRM